MVRFGRCDGGWFGKKFKLSLAALAWISLLRLRLGTSSYSHPHAVPHPLELPPHHVVQATKRAYRDIDETLVAYELPPADGRHIGLLKHERNLSGGQASHVLHD